ncbi:hypothetical protein L6164_008749 [Bauhinia variegata]|uniref:Uncharacterized protein n=1 Tax=Bauhinia variegata TaxID=167791 RepID=A0ACB9PHG1_BAUVA|nr:hypothetical protein L6164_008749 [Bauhinia variegata]
MIFKIQKDNREWVDDLEGITQEANNFYQNLFISVEPRSMDDILGNFPRKLSSTINYSLTKEVPNEEIKGLSRAFFTLVNYGNFMHGLMKENIQLNRKVLSELSMHEPYSFKALVDISKNAFPGNKNVLVPPRKEAI